MRSVETKVRELRVKGTTAPKSLAGSIHACFVNDGVQEVQLTAVGASAVNQATKGIAIASSFLANNANNLGTTIGFTNVIIDEKEKSAMIWRLRLI